MIFDVDASGIRRFVDDLSKTSGFSVVTGTAAIGQIVEKRDFGSGASLQLFQKLLKAGAASFEANVTANSVSAVEYSIDAYVVTPQRSALFARQWMQRNVKPETSHRYFLVREGLSVNSVAYTTTENVIGRLGGDVAVRKMLAADVDLLRGSTSNLYILKQVFKLPLWACLLTDEMRPTASIAGDVAWLTVREPMPLNEAAQ